MFARAFTANSALLTHVTTCLARFNDASHDVAHIHRVLANLDKIVSRQGLFMAPTEFDITLWAAACHDNRDHKYTGCISHKEEWEFIAKYMGPPIADRVMSIIDGVSWSKQVAKGKPTWDPILYMIQDADRLDAMGEQGLTRCRIFNGIRNPDATPDQLETLVRAHAAEKLALLYGALNYDVSRDIADAENLVAPIMAIL